MSEPVRIVPSVLKKQIDEGMKINPLAEHYGLPVSQMRRVLKELNLTIRRFHHPRYVIVDETVEETQEETVGESTEEVSEESTETITEEASEEVFFMGEEIAPEQEEEEPKGFSKW